MVSIAIVQSRHQRCICCIYSIIYSCGDLSIVKCKKNKERSYHKTARAARERYVGAAYRRPPITKCTVLGRAPKRRPYNLGCFLSLGFHFETVFSSFATAFSLYISVFGSRRPSAGRRRGVGRLRRNPASHTATCRDHCPRCNPAPAAARPARGRPRSWPQTWRYRCPGPRTSSAGRCPRPPGGET